LSRKTAPPAIAAPLEPCERLRSPRVITFEAGDRYARGHPEQFVHRRCAPDAGEVVSVIPAFGEGKFMFALAVALTICALAADARSAPPRKPNPVETTDRATHLPLAEVLLPQLLRRSGYASGIIGKWHVGESPPAQPNQRGFDYFFGGLLGGNEQRQTWADFFAALDRGAKINPA
jgi:hypothetical protein